jgi:hypothetical protein
MFLYCLEKAMKHVYTIDLSPRENRHWQDSPVADVWAIIKLATLGGLVYVIVWLVML